ncbi:unnamed protein product [Rhizoctonia solani]|uniref:Metacaspase-1 n=2 Tax=Rhizoctonia solani TaxID=456999 RepID=A0A8H3B9L2_9AGAM|nr:unnamed protein product [Rhizoctonia solani]CAE6451152.1 unnamed protein product [Rhizoctonia solani]
MGKSDSRQPAHSTIGAISYARPSHRRRARSKTVSRRDSVLFTEKSSDPPLLTSSVNEEWYDAEEYLAASPDEDGDIFYELYDEHKPVLATVQQVIPEPEYDGACKGRIDRKGINRSAPSPASPATCFFPPPPTPNPGFPVTRGSTKPAVNLAPGFLTTNPTAEEARKAVVSPPRQSVKKALVVGINYPSLDKDKRLYYAVNDAKLWRETFMGKGVELENLKIITDDGDMRYAPTFNALLGHIRWLVEDARDGDSLFFVFSGHALLTQNFGPSILTADKVIFPRPLLERELVMSVPAGVDLQVVFDCCHSAGMIGLQYCVGRMAKPTPPSNPSAEDTCSAEHEPAESQSTPPLQSSPFSHSPQQKSLHGSPMVVEDTAPPPVTPDMVNLDTFGSPPQRPPRGGVVAASPLANTTAAGAGTQPGGAAAGAARFLGSFFGLGSTPAPTSAPAPPPVQSELPSRSGPRRTQGVVEGIRMPDYFEERKQGFVAPAGKVMVWAGTGESQKAFESYGGARQGVLTKAMCAALERITTRRDLWSYLVQEIESENSQRTMRDAGKSVDQRPSPSSRIQHAELWVSQAHLTTQPSSAPVLDQPIFIF